MWINLDDKISQPIFHDIKDKNGQLTGKQRILIPVFELYSKDVGTCRRSNRITKFVYEIKTSSKIRQY